MSLYLTRRCNSGLFFLPFTENLLTDIWSLKHPLFLMLFSTALLSTKQGGSKNISAFLQLERHLPTKHRNILNLIATPKRGVPGVGWGGVYWFVAKFLGEKLNPRSAPKQMVGKINCSMMRKGAFKLWPWNCGSVCTIRKQLGPEIEVEETYPTICHSPPPPPPPSWRITSVDSCTQSENFNAGMRTSMLGRVWPTVQQEELTAGVFPTNIHFCSLSLALSSSFQVPDLVWNCLSCLKCTFPLQTFFKVGDPTLNVS